VSAPVRTAASLPLRRPAYEEALRAAPMHRRQSLVVAFGSNCLCRPHGGDDRRTLFQSGSQLLERRSLGHMTNLAEQVVGKRHARQRRPRFEPTMQRVRDVANLNHRGHVQKIKTCVAHVNWLSACWNGDETYFAWGCFRDFCPGPAVLTKKAARKDRLLLQASSSVSGDFYRRPNRPPIMPPNRPPPPPRR
jgi:hypothetical protein